MDVVLAVSSWYSTMGSWSSDRISLTPEKNGDREKRSTEQKSQLNSKGVGFRTTNASTVYLEAAFSRL